MNNPFTPEDVQLEIPPGIIDFRWGHPAADLMPFAGLAGAAGAALTRNGVAALSYGRTGGPASLIEPLTEWLTSHDDPIPEGNHLFITAGISQGLDMLCTLFSSPGEVVLVESPVYHLALKVFRDHHLVLVPVDGDADGIRPAALAEALNYVRAAGQHARFIYTVPTYNNPTGATVPAERRREIVALAKAAGAVILEDDVYRQLWFDALPPPPLQSFDSPGVVIRLGSFSKLLAPGLRLGWLIAPADVTGRCKDSGLLDSGGGLSHMVAHIVGEYVEIGLLDPQVERLRASYKMRCEALLQGLAQHMPQEVTWTRPGGGFFVWLTLPEGMESEALQDRAKEAGVAFVPGSQFCCCGGGERSMRLAFSLLDEAQLQEGAKRLAQTLTLYIDNLS